MLEALPVFAAVSLAAHAAGVTNAETALGAQLFLIARVRYAAVYMTGIPYLRTMLWWGGNAGVFSDP